MTQITHYPTHVVCDIFLPLSAEEYEELKTSISAIGQTDPITLWKGKIIDGKHRNMICQELGTEPKVAVLDEAEDPVLYAMTQNPSRQPKTTSQRAMAAARLSIESTRGGTRRGKDYTARAGVCTVGRAANLMGVGRQTVMHARTVIQHGDPEMIRRVMLPYTNTTGDRITVSQAAMIVAERKRSTSDSKSKSSDSTASPLPQCL